MGSIPAGPASYIGVPVPIHNFFHSFVSSDIININNEDLKQYAYQEQQTSPGRQMTNRGGWQSNILNRDDTILQPLIENILIKANELHSTLGFKDTLYQALDNMWININPPGGRNEYHRHPRSFFSGTYYVATDKLTGPILFRNPIQVHNWVITPDMIGIKNEFNGRGCEFNPSVGTLLFFPSWLEHRVNENNSDINRISISFNTQIVPKLKE